MLLVMSISNAQILISRFHIPMKETIGEIEPEIFGCARSKEVLID